MSAGGRQGFRRCLEGLELGTLNCVAMKCPANSHYELCTRACPSRCKEATTITKCPNNCAEGCQCRKGYFMAGYHCAPISQCRCFHKGMWFKASERKFMLQGLMDGMYGHFIFAHKVHKCAPLKTECGSVWYVCQQCPQFFESELTFGAFLIPSWICANFL
ncbi:IgGFc-binding protein [Varanus komodoensis]|nr:IgGFc-binding protein [Varanus komodoensis]